MFSPHSSPPTWKEASLDEPSPSPELAAKVTPKRYLPGFGQIEPVVEVEPHGLEGFERGQRSRRLVRLEVGISLRLSFSLTVMRLSLPPWLASAQTCAHPCLRERLFK